MQFSKLAILLAAAVASVHAAPIQGTASTAIVVRDTGAAAIALRGAAMVRRDEELPENPDVDEEEEEEEVPEEEGPEEEEPEEEEPEEEETEEEQPEIPLDQFEDDE